MPHSPDSPFAKRPVKTNPMPKSTNKEEKKRIEKICGQYVASHHGKDIYCSNEAPCKVHGIKPLKIRGVKNPQDLVFIPTPTKEECAKKCGLCGICNRNVHGSAGGARMTPTPSPSKWEEEFDREFKDSFTGGDMNSWESAKLIKSFIRQVESQTRSSVLEEVHNEILKHSA